MLLGQPVVFCNDKIAVLIVDCGRGKSPLEFFLVEVDLDLSCVESGQYFFVIADSEGLQKYRNGNFLPVIDVHGKHIPGSKAEFKPGAAVGNYLRRIGFLSGNLLVLREIYPGGSRELIDDDALRPVDDERSSIRHQRKVAKENFFFLDFHRLPVDQPDRRPDRPGPGQVSLTSFLFLRARFVEKELDELKRKGSIIAFDRENLVKKFLEPLLCTLVRMDRFLIEPAIGLSLHLDHIRNFDQIAGATEGQPLTLPPYGNELGHGTNDLPISFEGM